MFQIKYNNVFLDISTSEQSEIARFSPLFLIDNILAEYTPPFTLPYSDINSQALGYYFFDTTIKTQKKILVEIYDNDTFRYPATMVVESAGMNFNLPGKGNAAGYLLVGISNFFTKIKDKMLRDLSLGGDRIFNFTTTDPLDSSAGYWQHFQSTYDFTYDYVMLPCLNDAFTDEDLDFTYTNEWMNKYDGEKIAIKQPVTPWPKLEYVLNKIFEENGWTLDTTAIDDTEWKKLLLYSNYSIQTAYYSWDDVHSEVDATDRPSVTINLANAMPAGITQSKFIFEICKRYLWAPVCDAGSNVCRMIALKDVGNVTPVDFTKYADAGSQSEFSLPERIFAFKNNFVGEDQLPSAPDFTEWKYNMWRYSFNELPNLIDGNYDEVLAYTYLENKYWRVDWDSSGHEKEWVEYGDNIYDKDPDNATDTFETDVTTLPLKWRQLDNGFWAALPHVNQEKMTAWGIRTVIYHGMVQQVNDSGSPIDFTYPLGSSINVPPGRTPVLTWSNVYEHSDFENEFGIIEYWAKKWMQLVANTEEITQRFYLPLHILMTFKWEVPVLIRSMGYLIKSFVEPLPYNGYIEAKLQRITRVPNAGGVPPDTQTDVHFTDNPTLIGTDQTYEGLQYLKGPAGAVVTITITTLTKSHPYESLLYFKVDDTEYFAVDDFFTITLDSNGDGVYNVKCGGVVPAGNAIFAVVTITAVTIGEIGTPNDAGYDKVIT
jgi:hypothetical protein